MITRILIVVGLVLSCGLCSAEDFPEDTKDIKAISGRQLNALLERESEKLSRHHYQQVKEYYDLPFDEQQELIDPSKRTYVLDLSGLNSIDRLAAGTLVKQGRFSDNDVVWNFLNLDGLKKIDPSSLRLLLKWVGTLSLGGLTSIDKDVAQELARPHASCVLNLNGLMTMDLELAQKLAKFQGAGLRLDSLTSIDKDVAQELAKYLWKPFYLQGLNSIDEGVAAALVTAAEKLIRKQGFGSAFKLPPRIPSITEATAQELAKYMRIALLLNGLTSIDKEVAQELAKV